MQQKNKVGPHPKPGKSSKSSKQSKQQQAQPELVQAPVNAAPAEQEQQQQAEPVKKAAVRVDSLLARLMLAHDGGNLADEVKSIGGDGCARVLRSLKNGIGSQPISAFPFAQAVQLAAARAGLAEEAAALRDEVQERLRLVDEEGKGARFEALSRRLEEVEALRAKARLYRELLSITTGEVDAALVIAEAAVRTTMRALALRSA